MSCRFDVNSFASRNVARAPRATLPRVDFAILAGVGAPVRHFKAREVIFRRLFLVGRTPHFALNVMRVLAQWLRTTS